MLETLRYGLEVHGLGQYNGHARAQWCNPSKLNAHLSCWIGLAVMERPRRNLWTPWGPSAPPAAHRASPSRGPVPRRQVWTVHHGVRGPQPPPPAPSRALALTTHRPCPVCYPPSLVSSPRAVGYPPTQTATQSGPPSQVPSPATCETSKGLKGEDSNPRFDSDGNTSGRAPALR